MRRRPEDLTRLCEHWLDPKRGAVAPEDRLRDTLLAVLEILGATGAGVASPAVGFVGVGDLEGAAELIDGPDAVSRRGASWLIRRTLGGTGGRTTVIFRFPRKLEEGAEEAVAVDAVARVVGPACQAMVTAQEREFADYELLSLLGEGGMAVVHLVRRKDGPTTELFALKRIRHHLAKDDLFLGMFAREAQAVSQISHPHVVRVFEYGVARGQAYLTMEYLRGASIAKLAVHAQAASVSFPPEVVLALGRQLCAGLEAVHAEGIVHCDVSPQNLFVTHDGLAKLFDFGIARGPAAAQAGNHPSGARGKVGYVAPEQLVNGPFDHRADLFGLGVVLYELLAGGGAQLSGTLGRYGRNGLPPLSEAAPQLPRRIADAVMSALAMDPAERVDSAAALAAQLEAARVAEGLIEIQPPQLTALVRRILGERADARPGPAAAELVPSLDGHDRTARFQ